jgi:hypothetical protein
MTKALEVHDRIARITRELGEINKQMTPETTPAERLALLKLEHTATGAAIAALEQEERTRRWAGKKLSELSMREKAAMVSDLGAAEYERRVREEFDR